MSGDSFETVEACEFATNKLREESIPEPEASAEILLSELLGIKRGRLSSRCLSDGEYRVFETWVSRRRDREPVQRILGYAYFRNLKLDLDENTLIPRPDTESVVEAALERIDLRGPCRVLDLGTGSGAIAVSIAQERPDCEVHASDFNAKALRIAERNAASNGASVKFYRADVASGLESLRGEVDLLVSNPPYIESGKIEGLEPEVRDWDPAFALDGGPDGLDFYRRIFDETPALLRGGAEVVLEIGAGQSEEVLRLGKSARFTPLGVRDDLAGISRAALLGWEW